MSTNKLYRKRLGEQLTTQIRKYIIDHGLKPGDPLLTEQELVERFGVSRPVVREATKALDFLGIIHSMPRRGMVLDEFNFDRVSEYFGFHFALSDYPEEILLKARVAIETGALFYTMQSVKEDSALGDFLMVCVEKADCGGDIETWIEDDIAFHRALVETSGVTPLSAFCDLIQVFFRRFRDRTAVGDLEAGKQQHRQIVEAIVAEKLDTAVDLLRYHLHWYEHDGQVSCRLQRSGIAVSRTP